MLWTKRDCHIGGLGEFFEVPQKVSALKISPDEILMSLANERAPKRRYVCHSTSSSDKVRCEPKSRLSTLALAESCATSH